jgi:hypothetical protein
MGDNVNIKVPDYYYWEGQSPTLPVTDTTVAYKLIGPDSTSIQLSTGFSIKNNNYSFEIRANAARTITITFSSGVGYSNTTGTNGTNVVARTRNGTEYRFTGSATGRPDQYDVNSGTITIKESPDQLAQNNLKGGLRMTEDAAKAYVQNTKAQGEFLETTTFFSSSKTLENLSKLFYFFFEDFFTLVVLSFFIITVTIIVKVDASLIYPFDTTKFPYVTKDYKRNVSDVTKGTSFCDNIIDVVNIPGKANDEDIPVLNIFNPNMVKPDENKISWYSASFQNSCKNATNTSSGAFAILKYWMLYLSLNNFVNLQFTLNTLHGGLKFISNDTFMMFIFTVLLFALYYLIPNINIGLIQPYLHYSSGQEVKFNADTFSDFSGKRGITNLALMIIFNILALFMVIFIPLFMILATTGIISNILSLIRILMSTSSVECMFLSFFAIISSINYVLNLLPENYDVTKIVFETNINNLSKQVIDFILNMFRLVRMPELSVNNIFFFFINILNFLGSIFGILLPFFMALCYSLLTSASIIRAMIALPLKNIKIVKSLAPILIIFLLAILLKNVQMILGYFMFFITIFIILIIGYIISK